MNTKKTKLSCPKCNDFGYIHLDDGLLEEFLKIQDVKPIGFQCPKCKGSVKINNKNISYVYVD